LLEVLPLKRSSVDTIVFDIGRVIVKLDPLRAFTHISGMRRKSGAKTGSSSSDHTSAGRELYVAIQRDPLWIDWQEGRVTPQEWHRNLCRRFGVKAGYDEFRRAWNSTIVPEPNLMLPLRLFADLHSRFRLVLLSNTDPLHVEHMLSSFTFMRHFDAGVYSCEVGASKPSHAIFRASIRASKSRPTRILFIDDVREYTVAARRLGMQSIQFRNRLQLEHDFRALGLIR